jgi:anti-sigma factor RsiW
MAKYLYEVSGGRPHGYFDDDEKYVYSADGHGALYYRDGKYLYAVNGHGAVAYQDGKYFYGMQGGKALWYLAD